MIKKRKKEHLLMNTENEDIAMMAEIEDTAPVVEVKDIDQELPIMTLRNMVVFPTVIMPVAIGRPPTLKLVDAALKEKKLIVLATQKVSEVEEPELKDLFPVAVIGRILRVFEIPGGNTTAIVQAHGPKVYLDKITSTHPYMKGKVTVAEDDMTVENTDEFKALMDTCREQSMKYIEVSDRISSDTSVAIKNLETPELLVNFISSNFPFPIDSKFDLLSANSLKERLWAACAEPGGLRVCLPGDVLAEGEEEGTRVNMNWEDFQSRQRAWKRTGFEFCMFF